MEKIIIEKQLGIPSDYQYKAIRSKNYLQANWHKNKLTALEELVPFEKSMRVLDLGTGSGNFEFEFFDKFSDIVGIDYNDEAISFLQSQLVTKSINNVKLYIKDVRETSNIPDIGKFDLIVMVDVIEHLPEKDAVKLLTDVKQLLNKGGQFVIITPNYKSAWLAIEWLLDRVSFVPKFAGSQHLAKFYKSNLYQMLANSGYKVSSLTTFNLFSFVLPSKRLSTILTKLEVKYLKSFGNLLAVVAVND